MLSLRKRGFAVLATQASFSPEGGLVVQTSISTFQSEIEIQATLDRWLSPAAESTLGEKGNKLNTKPACNIFLEDWDDTISCIELEMKRGKGDYLVDWMKGEPRGDNWDGSVDNQEKIIENHVEKHGWLF